MIVKTSDELMLVFAQALIHTSDPGQYGVNKSAETVTIKSNLSRNNKVNNTSKELWGLVDGVGFIENPRKTIDKMLIQFDCFIQLKSLYKAGLQLHKLGLVKLKGIRFDSDFYTTTEANEMFEKYGSADIQLVTEQMPDAREITAGKAWLYL